MKSRFLFTAGSACALALLVTGCGGGGSSSSGGSTGGTPTPSPAPAPAPAPAPTYQTLAELQGDQAFDSAEGNYVIDLSAGGPRPVQSPDALAFGAGTAIRYTLATDELRLAAPGGDPKVTITQNSPTSTPPGTRQWQITNGSVTDVVTLFDATTALYSFIGTWAHIENNVATYRLVTAGIPTKSGDFPTGTATYDVAIGGSIALVGSSQPVSPTNSMGTLTLNYTAKTGTLSIPLKDAGGADLGTVTATIAISSTSSGFTGTTTFDGVTGKISGSVYGPQAREASFAIVLGNNEKSYVGLGGGLKR